jgi:hypothetical protein
MATLRPGPGDRLPPVAIEISHDTIVGLRKAAAARDMPVKSLIGSVLDAAVAETPPPQKIAKLTQECGSGSRRSVFTGAD